MIYGDADYNSKQLTSHFVPHRTENISYKLLKQICNPGNWLGGEAVYESLHTGTPGYVNITTPDSLVHGQAKQIGSFAFARIYDAGHEVPYYQPLTALTIFDRAINGHDIATGQTKVNTEYLTEGEAESTYREGNSTLKSGQDVLSQTATYDAAPQTDPHSPEPAGPGESGSEKNRLLSEVDGSVGLVPLNGTRGSKLAVAPHGGGGKVVGLVNPELKLKVEQLVHISQKKRRRRRRGVRGGHFK